jgi:hypothetical protein
VTPIGLKNLLAEDAKNSDAAEQFLISSLECLGLLLEHASRPTQSSLPLVQLVK